MYLLKVCVPYQFSGLSCYARCSGTIAPHGKLLVAPSHNFTGTASMINVDDYRLRSHQLLLELDAANTHLMMLVSARQIDGPLWMGAADRHKLAYEAWASFLNAPVANSMRALDGRAAGSYTPLP
jgi:hypothetical protein